MRENRPRHSPSMVLSASTMCRRSRDVPSALPGRQGDNCGGPRMRLSHGRSLRGLLRAVTARDVHEAEAVDRAPVALPMAGPCRFAITSRCRATNGKENRVAHWDRLARRGRARGLTSSRHVAEEETCASFHCSQLHPSPSSHASRSRIRTARTRVARVRRSVPEIPSSSSPVTVPTCPARSSAGPLDGRGPCDTAAAPGAVPRVEGRAACPARRTS